MKKRLSWRTDWLLAALSVVFFGLAKSILPYYARLSQLSKGLEMREEAANSAAQSALLTIAFLLALAFLARLIHRFFNRKNAHA